MYHSIADIENLKNKIYITKNGAMSDESITMIHTPNLNNIQNLYKYIVDNDIQGDILEAGVWKVGATILMAALNKYYNTPRLSHTLYIFYLYFYKLKQSFHYLKTGLIRMNPF